jgi:hypothetical protein
MNTRLACFAGIPGNAAAQPMNGDEPSCPPAAWDARRGVEEHRFRARNARGHFACSVAERSRSLAYRWFTDSNIYLRTGACSGSAQDGAIGFVRIITERLALNAPSISAMNQESTAPPPAGSSQAGPPSPIDSCRTRPARRADRSGTLAPRRSGLPVPEDQARQRRSHNTSRRMTCLA